MTLIEKTTHAVVVLACLVATFTYVERRGGLGSRVKASPEGQLTGSQISIPGVDWKTDSIHVVLAFSAKCTFCRMSLPFYSSLAQIIRSPLRVVTPDPTHEVAGIFAAAQITSASFHQLGLDKLGIKATPTLLVVDTSGRVVKDLVGRLDPEREEKLIAMVRTNQ